MNGYQITTSVSFFASDTSQLDSFEFHDFTTLEAWSVHD